MHNFFVLYSLIPLLVVVNQKIVVSFRLWYDEVTCNVEKNVALILQKMVSTDVEDSR